LLCTPPPPPILYLLISADSLSLLLLSHYTRRDPYLRVVEYKLKEGGARVLAALTPLKGREAVELLKTPVQKKVRIASSILTFSPIP